MSNRQLPKSLHTVTVLVNLSRHIMVGADVDDAVIHALRILKLSDLQDSYGLAEAAKKILRKECSGTAKQSHKGIDAPYVGPAAVWNLSFRGSDFS